MPRLHDLQQGLTEAWDSLMDGWQRLYGRAAGAITRFTPGAKERAEPTAAAQERETRLAERSTGWGVLAAEVFDDDDKVLVRLEAPGMDKADFDLQVVEDRLLVRGEKRVEREGTEGRYYVTERAYGRFERKIPLPAEVQADKAEARYDSGVLRVELPKAQPQGRRAKTIEVR